MQFGPSLLLLPSQRWHLFEWVGNDLIEITYTANLLLEYGKKVNDIGTNETNILDKVVGSTQSELILFFVIIVVAMVVVMIPLYTLMSKDKKQKNQLENTRQENYIKRESRIIEVITANTETQAALKATLESFNTATTLSFTRIHERLDTQGDRLGEVFAIIMQIKTTLDHSISNQKEMADDLNKTLLIVDRIFSINNIQYKT